MKSLKEILSRISGKKQTAQDNAGLKPIRELQSEQNKETFLPNEEVPTFEQVDETPFTLMETSKGVQILCGNAIIDRKTFKNKNEAKKYIYRTPYQLCYNFLCFAVENVKKSMK